MVHSRRRRPGIIVGLSLLMAANCRSFSTPPNVAMNGHNQPHLQSKRTVNDIVTDERFSTDPVTTAKRLLSSSASLFTVLSLLTSSPSTSSAALTAVDDSTQGISIVTQSTLGKSVRSSIVSSAKIADNLDLKWERISDSLRDKQKCDPRTNRRLFDNGTRKDGTPIGNPVLGALCEPEVLKSVDGKVVDVVLGTGEDAAVEVLGLNIRDLQERETKVEKLVGGAFKLPSSDKPPTETNDETLRRGYNKDLYVRMRSYSETISTQNTERPSLLSRKLERTWGTKLLTKLAPSASRDDFTSPFPKPDPVDDRTYDEGALLDALGAVSITLTKLQAGGLIGHWEISIPEDDFWNVVTIAVDDDVSINGQILARERGQGLSGSVVTGVVRSAIEGKGISYALDTFFIDPTTTKQELYNPTQLLISLSNLGQ